MDTVASEPIRTLSIQREPDRNRLVYDTFRRVNPSRCRVIRVDDIGAARRAREWVRFDSVIVWRASLMSADGRQ
jgi:hypothetical protein